MQTALHNSKQKQMQRRSSVYNWFSRATFCCHSLPNQPPGWRPVAHQTSHVKRRQTLTAIPPLGLHRAGKLTSPQDSPSETGSFLCINAAWLVFPTQPEMAKYPKPPGKAWHRSCLSGTRPFSRDNRYPRAPWCLPLRSWVSLWASVAKLLIGHGSSITQRNPFHQNSHPNS